MSLVSKGVHPPRLDEPRLSDGAWDLIQRCWERNPMGRPRMNDVVESMIAMSPKINADDASQQEESSIPDSTSTQIGVFY